MLGEFISIRCYGSRSDVFPESMIRGACSVGWCAAKPTGTAAKFASYWNSIKGTAEAEVSSIVLSML